jgi:hypothetical protein
MALTAPFLMIIGMSKGEHRAKSIKNKGGIKKGIEFRSLF